MQSIDLAYGRTTIPFDFDPERFDVLCLESNAKPLSDAEIGNLIDSPIGSPQLEDLVRSGERVLIAVPDATRRAGAGQCCNLLIRRLIAAGINPADIRIIFATGIHRPVTESEKTAILGDFIARRIVAESHDSRNIANLIRLGTTSNGIPIELNRALVDYAFVITISSVGFHYFAGFTGGRKIICPGLASTRTITQTHRLAFDFRRKRRADGVAPGRLEGNPVHEAFVEVASAAAPHFSINTIIGRNDEITEMFCGDWMQSHRAACEAFRLSHTIHIKEKRKNVVVSCGGFPYDINMIQAHKALQNAALACEPGGNIILIAQCPDGAGHTDFAGWFSAGDSDGIAGLLEEKYQVNGQTAWSIRKIAEQFNVRIVSSLPAGLTEKMGFAAMQSLSRAVSKLPQGKGYILPLGARFAIEMENN